MRSEESAHLILGTEDDAIDEASDQEGASMQLIPVRHKVSTELYIDAIRPFPIVPIRDKYILPDMCMSPTCHEAVPVPEKTSTPLVEALLQIFRRRVFPKEIQTDEGTLFMSISTTELFEKLGMPLRKPFTFKNAFKYFRRVMPELSREYKKFYLSYLDNVVVFSEGWDFPIDHMDGILELNTHLAVRPVEFELAQDGVEYCGHVVGVGKQSPAQLKRKEEFVANVVPAPFNYVGDRKRMVLLPEEVREMGFLESRSFTFRIDSSGKDMRNTGFEDPDWRQKA
ncbi:uncharacterized protein TNCV_1618401 [Trichonephila clavipes]|nr:uncharacterized protein TNCV_1618401 [Trichonephila clavipes]